MIRVVIPLLFLLSGIASISWEVLWQIKTSLALGVSAQGTAITLATMMGGMCLGSYLSRYVNRVSPGKMYGILELTIGIAGLSLSPILSLFEKLDSQFYVSLPNNSIYITGILIVLGLPSLCMGMTLPIITRLAQMNQISIAKLYAINIFGAALGVLITALYLVPVLGVEKTIFTIAFLNSILFLCGLSLPKYKNDINYSIRNHELSYSVMALVFVSGFATFTLEIAWFRSLSSTYQNTTDIFAIMLASVLIALGWAASSVPKLQTQKKSLPFYFGLAGVIILSITPLVERFDWLFFSFSQSNASQPTLSWLLDPISFNANSQALLIYIFQLLILLFLTCLLLVPPMRLLGLALPWHLSQNLSHARVSTYYAINTIGSVIGAISASWFFLPTIGLAKTASATGFLVSFTGTLLCSNRHRIILFFLTAIALSLAIHYESGIGKTRVQGFFARLNGVNAKVLGFEEGPDTRVAAVEYQDGQRALLINSAVAAGEDSTHYRKNMHYMAWMGHLPMVMHAAAVKNALVICFGTGQTANAVWKESPEVLDVVEINPSIYKLAKYFPSNERILEQKRVHPIIMDGRAYLRRTYKTYDVITLEPMPPIMAGVNALYSKEFYQLANSRLTSTGIIAQWLPFHVVAPHFAASIAKTFISVFPNALLWIDPEAKNGILIGAKNNEDLVQRLRAGLLNKTTTRNLTADQTLEAVTMTSLPLKKYAEYGELITDNNQRLAYGKALYANVGMLNDNFRLLHVVEKKFNGAVRPR